MLQWRLPTRSELSDKGSKMFKSTVEKIKRSLVLYLMVFMCGSFVGDYSSYVAISKDCAIMGKFRIDRMAYSCQRLAP